MPWVRMDDGYPDHPKVDKVGPLAAWLNVCAWAYCARNLTDGFVPSERVARLSSVKNPGALSVALVAAKLWEEVEDGYVVHDYLAYNPTREMVLAERGMRQVRKDLYADPFMRGRIKKRDEDLCRYCGKLVVWEDRKSPRGGTYDHVDPRGGNSDENLVVACRGCNSTKGQRSPDEAGMVLRPAPPHLNGTTAEFRNNPGANLDNTQTEPESESGYPYPSPTRTRLKTPVPDPDPAAAAARNAREVPNETSCWKCAADRENGAVQGHRGPCEVAA